LWDKFINRAIDLVFSKSSIIGIFIIVVIIMHFVGFDLTQIGLNPLTMLIIIVLIFFVSVINYGNIELIKDDITTIKNDELEHQSLKTLIESVSMISERLKVLSELSMDTNHSIKGIPSKKLIIMQLTALTLFLSVDILKKFLEYIFAINSNSNQVSVDRYQKKLDRDYTGIKANYISKVDDITKGCLEISSEEKINDLFDNLLNRIYTISVSSTMMIEDKVSEVINFVEDLKEELRKVYEENLFLKYIHDVKDD
jgi:hypothetical protein